MKLAVKILLLTLGALLSTISYAAERDTKQNIVFILVDNVGLGDWSVYGGTTPTLCIDELAS